jgi:hypothetical protein
MPYKDPEVHKAYQREHMKYRNRVFKQACVDYKGGECERCGYSRSLRALHFHHPNDDKEFNISDARGKGWEKVTDELDKCELLCGNCHMEQHDETV